MEKIIIRRGNPKDIDELARLSQMWREADIDKKRQFLEICFTLPNFIMFVAEYDNKIIGLFSAYIRYTWVNGEKRLWIDSVFTHPEFRKKGVMRKLWEEIKRTVDYDIALIDTRFEYPLHLGFELGMCKLYIKRKEK